MKIVIYIVLAIVMFSCQGKNDGYFEVVEVVLPLNWAKEQICIVNGREAKISDFMRLAEINIGKQWSAVRVVEYDKRSLPPGDRFLKRLEKLCRDRGASFEFDVAFGDYVPE